MGKSISGALESVLCREVILWCPTFGVSFNSGSTVLLVCDRLMSLKDHPNSFLYINDFVHRNDGVSKII